MTTKKEEVYVYHYTNLKKPVRFNVRYTLYFTNKKLTEVRNEYNCKLEENSERYLYFMDKYKN